MPDRLAFQPSRRGLILGSLSLAAGPGFAQTQQPAAPVPVREVKLTLQAVKRPIGPGAPSSELFLVNGSFPGPVIRVKKGEPIDLRIENSLTQPTALHIHGLRGANSAEDVPGLTGAPIAPGETRTIRVETPDAGTFTYVPVLPGKVSEQLERGLGGVFVVEEAAPPAVDHDHVLALDDVRLDDKGVLVADFGNRLDAGRSGRLGNQLLANGVFAPEMMTVRPGARIRLRLASLANARIMPMKFENVKATVVALDGQPCDPFDPLKRTVVLLPGSRYDVMLDAPAEAGQDGRVLVALGTGLAVLKIRTEGEPLPARAPVVSLPFNDVPPAIRLQNSVRTELLITGGIDRPAQQGAPWPSAAELDRKFGKDGRFWTLNTGVSNGFSGKPIATVKKGSPVVIALVNRTQWSQIVTVQGHVFRLLHPLDDGWEPYFLDTIHLPEGTTSRIAFDAVNVGKWAIRSTVAEHYDSGFYSWFEVVP
ncbi:MAG: multicopper oxidase family protein [Proteobacteria bacterium]|nr:multicopper oxidase family protein [Pseudomonadota bacterium]